LIERATMTNAPAPELGPRERILGGPTLRSALAEWWEDLAWPRVLGAARLGLRPGRLGLALFAVLIAWVLLDVGLMVDARLVKSGVVWSCPEGTLREHVLGAPWRLFVSVPKACFLGAPFTSLVIGPVLLAITVMLLGAISRIVACEMGQAQNLTWTEGLTFSVARWRSMLGALLGPLVVLWLIALALGLGGLVLMRWPVLNLVGALGYGLFLLAGLIGTLIVIGYALGHGLYLPAVACEGADAIDAVQRGYTYTFARPLRLIFYYIVGLLGLIVVVGIVGLIVQWTVGFAAMGAGAWAGDKGQAMVWAPTHDVLSSLPGWTARPKAANEGTYAAGAWLIRLWTAFPLLLVVAAWVSGAMAVHTAVYLGIRRVCDGQDFADIWEPGMIPGTMSDAMSSRGIVAAGLGISASTLSVKEEADYQ